MAGRAVFERLPSGIGLPARRDVLRAQLPLADPASDGPVADAEALSHISAGQKPFVGHVDQRTRRSRVGRLLQAVMRMTSDTRTVSTLALMSWFAYPRGRPRRRP